MLAKQIYDIYYIGRHVNVFIAKQIKNSSRP